MMTWTSTAGASFMRSILVGMEVRLLDTADLERDLTMERGRDAEDDRALNLGLNGIRVDDGAAIRRREPDHQLDA